MSGGGQNTTQTIQKSNPWQPQQPYLEQIMQQAQSLYNNKSQWPQPFPYPSTAAPNPTQVQAQNMLSGAATGPTQSLANEGAAAEQFSLGPVLYPQSNPALQASIQGAIDPLMRNWQNTVLPSIQSNFQMAGQPGSTRQGVAEGIAATNLNQQIADTTAQMESNAYGQGLTAQGRALALLPEIQAAQATPATQLGAVGGQQQAYIQALLNQALGNWNYQQQLPYQQLAQYANLVEGPFGGSSTGTGIGEQGLTSQLQSLLGTGLMGAGLYGMLGGGGLFGLGADVGMTGPALAPIDAAAAATMFA